MDLRRGLTIEKKLEKECYGYRRLDALLGGRIGIVSPFHEEGSDFY
jgi:hypothetical protein